MAAGFAAVLRERLGGDGYAALEEMIDVRQTTLLTVDRFEQRIGDELGKVRVEVADVKTALRGDIQQLRADLRIDVAERSAELMKWAMVFWVAQAAAVAGIVAALR